MWRAREYAPGGVTGGVAHVEDVGSAFAAFVIFAVFAAWVEGAALTATHSNKYGLAVSCCYASVLTREHPVSPAGGGATKKIASKGRLLVTTVSGLCWSG